MTFFPFETIFAVYQLAKRSVFLSFGVIAAILIQSITVTAITFKEDTTLTSEQKEILDKFRKLVVNRLPHEYMKDDMYLVNWLRARDFDIKDAEEFLMNNLEWRDEKNMDTISQEDWSDFDKNYYLDGRDKIGRSLLYFDIDTIDVRAEVVRDGERFLRYTDKMLEEGCQLVRDLGEKYKNITRGHLIINFEGYNLVQHGCLQCIPYILRFVLSYLEHYPGCVDKIILINAPHYVEPLINSIRPLLDPELNSRLKVFGTNKRIWKEELAKDFDFDKLPPGAGGTAIYAGMDY